MARPLRVEYPDAYYHVVNRGNTGKRYLKNKARKVAIYLAREMTRSSCKDLGVCFGGVSGDLIIMMHNRVDAESKRIKRLKGRINKN